MLRRALSILLLVLCASPRMAEAQPPARGEPFFDAVSETGQRARGLYLGASFVHGNDAQAVVDAVRSARMDAVVLDLKDAEGRIHYDTRIPELREARTGWLGDTRALVRTLHENDIYVIARVTCFADRFLPERLPARAIQHTRHGRPWVSWGTGGTWLDPYNAENHALVVAIAREVQALGFDEIQLDYVRFPVDDGVRYARYPAERSEPRPDVIMDMLRAVDEAITIPLGVDVFGIAAYNRGDSSGLGQDLEAWTRHVEVFTPMLYINSMRNWRRGEANRTFLLVYAGLNRLRERVGNGPVIRPFLQAFERGAGTELNVDFIYDQVRAVRRAHADGFLFWHPGHTYGVVRRAMRGRVRALLPIPISDAVLERRGGRPASRE